MTEIETQIEELTRRLAELQSRHLQMSDEIISAEKQLETLRTAVFKTSQTTAENASLVTPGIAAQQNPYTHLVKQSLQQKAIQPKRSFHINHEMEDFIGTNVISKIGILVTIIGVFIGAKYAIDNELISPFMRIAAGYAASVALILIAFRLKKKYQYFSSVLIGGGLAVTFFITYIAYSFYALFPLPVAFAVMVVTTGAAVAIALWYNQKIIALIGQVSAYAIPFLLSNNSGNILSLFAYISVINVGLLVLSFKKDWKILYHIAFFLTWLIYLVGLNAGSQIKQHFAIGLIFLIINFFTFYVTFLSYKIFRKEQYNLGEIGILLLNALFFFFLGIYLIEQSFESVHFLTWFTIANAAVHFIAGYCIYRFRLTDKTVFQFVLGLGLLFVTIAIPIELNGSWVTLLWTVEAVALFYIAFANKRTLYADIAVPLVIISVISLLQDWWYSYSYLQSSIPVADFKTVPFANANFWLSLFVCACLGYISYASAKQVLAYVKPFTNRFFSKIVPVVFLGILYFTFYNEIHFAWDQIINENQINHHFSDADISKLFQSLTLIMYSCLYCAIWLYVDAKLIRKENLHYLLLIVSAIVNIVFLLNGLYIIGELREKYLSKTFAGSSGWLISIRYFSFGALAILWLAASKAIKAFKPTYYFQTIISCLFNLTLLSVISNEFIHWMDLNGYQNQYKLGLSLICGGYAAALIFAGILKKKKHLRIAAMVLFSVTLLKLFFYDLASLSTISKTIVLVLLGILLLFASFLYNKYKDFLFGKEER